IGRRGEPGEGRVHDVARGTLGAGTGNRAVLEVLAEGGEALPEPEGGGHGIGADEGGRAIAVPLEDRGQRLVPRVEREDHVVPHAVHGGIEAGEDRRVRRAGHGHRALRVLEADAAGGQRVQARRAGAGGPVHTDVVGAQGVDDDEEEARRRRRGRLVTPPADGGQGGEGGDGNDRGGRCGTTARRGRRTGLGAGHRGLILCGRKRKA